VKAKARILTGRQHHLQTGRQPGEKRLEPRRGIGRSELVQIVDREHSRLL
jgi:hypothetical protein